MRLIIKINYIQNHRFENFHDFFGLFEIPTKEKSRQFRKMTSQMHQLIVISK